MQGVRGQHLGSCGGARDMWHLLPRLWMVPRHLQGKHWIYHVFAGSVVGLWGACGAATAAPVSDVFNGMVPVPAVSSGVQPSCHAAEDISETKCKLFDVQMACYDQGGGAPASLQVGMNTE